MIVAWLVAMAGHDRLLGRTGCAPLRNETALGLAGIPRRHDPLSSSTNEPGREAALTYIRQHHSRDAYNLAMDRAVERALTGKATVPLGDSLRQCA